MSYRSLCNDSILGSSMPIVTGSSLLGFVTVRPAVEVIEEDEHEEVLRHNDRTWPQRVAAAVDEGQREVDDETHELQHLQLSDVLLPLGFGVTLVVG